MEERERERERSREREREREKEKKREREKSILYTDLSARFGGHLKGGLEGPSLLWGEVCT